MISLHATRSPSRVDATCPVTNNSSRCRSIDSKRVFYGTLSANVDRLKKNWREGDNRNKKYVDFNTNFENPLEGRLNISFFFFFFFLQLNKQQTSRNDVFIIENAGLSIFFFFYFPRRTRNNDLSSNFEFFLRSITVKNIDCFFSIIP